MCLMQSVQVIAWAMIVFGIVLWWADGRWPDDRTADGWTVRDAVVETMDRLSVDFRPVLTQAVARYARRQIKLVETLLRRLVRSPMSFFDSTATGIIMNRMLQDIQNVDQYVPNSILDLSTKILTMVAQLALIRLL